MKIDLSPKAHQRIIRILREVAAGQVDKGFTAHQRRMAGLDAIGLDIAWDQGIERLERKAERELSGDRL